MFTGEQSLYLRQHRKDKGCTRIDLMSKISVVIPTLNEEKYIGPLLEQLQAIPEVTEIIVSDGGSIDNTQQIVTGFAKCTWIESMTGRAMQMNTGARKATSSVLLFLHADSRVDVNGMKKIPQTLLDKVGAGSFYLSFDCTGFWLNIYSGFSKFNWTIFTYGDQGLFIKRDLFEKIGGFKEIPIMEDLDIIRRIKRHTRFQKINFPITTCARRFKKHGVVFQQLKNIWLVSLFYLGVSPNWLSRFYRY